MATGARSLAGSRNPCHRYRAYEEAVHDWAQELREAGIEVDAPSLTWILYANNGDNLTNG